MFGPCPAAAPLSSPGARWVIEAVGSGTSERLLPLWPLFAVSTSVLLGGAIASDQLTLITLMALAMTGVGVAHWNRGVFAGVLVLFVLNGVPFINTLPSKAGGTNALDDIAFLLLLVTLAAFAIARPRNPERERLFRLACLWAAASLAWWGLKVILTVTTSGIPVVPAITYGRDFMYFSLLLPLALGGLRRRHDLIGAVVTLALGISMYALGQIINVVNGHDISWLIHVGKTADFQGIVRIYAPMNELLIAAFPLAFAATLIGPARWRPWAAAVAVLTGVANALSFTRAVYVGELVGLTAISVIWALSSGWGARTVRRAVAWGAVLSVMAVTLVGGSNARQASSASPLQAVVERAELGFTDVQNQSGNLGYRLTAARRDLQVLGGHWLTGLGFLNPKYRYFGGLREGSIRDSDLGSLNIVMTMGLIGLIVVYLPPCVGLIFLIRRRRGWFDYGGAIYLSAALIGSVTLATVSSVPGLLVLACALAITANWPATQTERQPRSVESRTPSTSARVGEPLGVIASGAGGSR